MARLGKQAPAAPEPAPTSSLYQVLLGWYGVVGMVLSYVLPFRLPFAEGYAKEYWRHALGSLLLALGLIGGLIGLTVYLLDANDFKGQIVDYIKANKQRDLVLEGDLQLDVFPQLGLDTGKMSLSQRNSSRTFAAVDNARLYIAWWPLLRGRLQIERVVLDGLHADLVRHADGSSNFDDLLVSATKLADVDFAVEKVRVQRAHLNYRDESANLNLALQDLELETGRLADATAGRIDARFQLVSAQPRLDTRVRLGGHLLYEHLGQRYQFKDFEARAQGQVAGWSALDLDLRGSLSAQPVLHLLNLQQLDAIVRGPWAGQSAELRLRADQLKLEAGQWQGKALKLDAKLQQQDRLLQAAFEVPALQSREQTLRSESLQATLALEQGSTRLQAQLAGPAVLDYAARQLQLPSLNGLWSASHALLAGKLIATRFNGQLLADGGRQHVRLDFKTEIEDSALSGEVQLQDFNTPAWTFDVKATRLDLDRHLVNDWPVRLQTGTQVQDWRALQGLNLRGRLRTDELRAARLQASAVSIGLRAAAGTLTVEPVEAQLYGGTFQGELSLGAIADVTGPASAVHLATRQKFSNVPAETLLALLPGGEGRLSGKGQLTLDLQAQGADLVALRQSLTGTASVALTGGTLAGIDLPEALLSARDQLGQNGLMLQDKVRLTEETPYREFKASWQIADGQARSSDLLLRTPLLNCKGELLYTLESGEVEAQLSTQVLPGLKRATGGELAELAGISVPLQISGPWASAELRYLLGEASGPALAQLQRARPAGVAPETAASATEAGGTVNTSTAK